MLLAILVLLSLLTPAKGADAPPIQCFPMEHLSGVVDANPGWHILPALSDAENAVALEIYEAATQDQTEFSHAFLMEHESGIGLLGVGFDGVACKRAMFGAEDFRRVKKAVMGTAI